MTSRQKVLASIRTSVPTAAADREQSYASIPRSYTRAGALANKARIALMIERLREYDAEVVECAPDDLGAAIRSQIAAGSRRRLIVPPEISAAGLIPATPNLDGLELIADRGLSTAEIEQAAGVVTEAFCGIAESGTIVLHHSAREGRRVLTLLPDWHLCILRASQIVETLPEYFALVPQPPALITWISGPSATADIEMTRIKGVHGPRFLHVVMVHDLAQ
ncbi:MAG: LUD domain-containing protein [Terracidiphilus sp.]